MKAKSTVKTTPLLDVCSVSAGYGGMPVLHDVTVQVYPAEIVALVGSNGAGKTTLLRVLSRVLPCTGGIVMDSHDLVPMTSEQAFAVGLVQIPEGRQLFDRMTVQDNLLMGAFRRPDKVAVARDLEKNVRALSTLIGAPTSVGWKHVGRRTANVRHGSRVDGGSSFSDDRRDELGIGARHRGTVDGCSGNHPRQRRDGVVGRTGRQSGIVGCRSRLRHGDRPHRSQRSCQETY